MNDEKERRKPGKDDEGRRAAWESSNFATLINENTVINPLKQVKLMLHYRIVERKKPGDDFAASKFYGCLVNPGIIDLDGLAKRISGNCTVTRADTLAVLSALEEQIIYALQSGMRVHLGDVGCFRLTCQGEGTELKEDYKTSLIKKLKVVFFPSKALREAVAVDNKDIKFYNVESMAMAADAGAVEEGGGLGV